MHPSDCTCIRCVLDASEPECMLHPHCIAKRGHRGRCVTYRHLPRVFVDMVALIAIKHLEAK